MNAKNASISRDARSIVCALKEHRGQFIRVTWERPMKTLQSCRFPIVKRTSAVVRSGIEYANLANVKAGIEAGVRGEVGELPYGEWIVRPFIIAHKGVEYLRLYTAPNAPAPCVEYVMDGVICSKNDVRPYVYASEFRERERRDCFNIKAESIISIG